MASDDEVPGTNPAEELTLAVNAKLEAELAEARRAYGSVCQTNAELGRELQQEKQKNERLFRVIEKMATGMARYGD